MRAFGLLLTSASLLPAAAQAQSEAAHTDIIVTAPGLAGDEAPADAVNAATLAQGGGPDWVHDLARALPGVSVSEAQDNPFQPNLVYHGYVVSPLQGTPQGLAVYLDGGRFNQPFGDTVDFDLLPEAAIDRLAIESASPTYGLNALGGALVVATKTGRSAPGGTLWAAGGGYGWREAGGEFGWSRGPWSLYATAAATHDGGWRRHSPSTLDNGYADVGYDGAAAGLHLKLIGADSDLTGNGSAPVELLAADRRAVFTWPDQTRNRFGRVSVHPWAALSAATRIEASLYLQHLRQRTANGDNADVEPCDDDEGLLCLEDSDGDAAPLRDRSGAQIPALLDDDAPYGVFNRTATDTTAGGALVQLIDRRPLLGGTSVLRIGASHDTSRTRFSAETELGTLTDTREVKGLGPIIDQPDGAIAPVGLIARTHYTGIFAAETLPLGAHVSLDLDLRYNHAAVALQDRIGSALSGRHHFDRLNPGVALAWRPSAALTLRAGYSEANRAPTPAELACAGPEAPCTLTNFFVGDPPLRQVVSRSWQASGTGSTDLGGWALRGQIDLYTATNSDDIQRIAAPVRGRGYFANVGRTRRRGLDLNLTARRGPWALHAGYAYTDASFRTALTLPSPDNPAADAGGLIHVAPGDTLPGVPRHRGILAADYEGSRFTLGADLQAQSGQVLFGDEANLQPRTPAFAVAGAHGSARVAGPLWLFVQVQNLFDRRYATFGTFSETGEVFLAEVPGASDPRSLAPGAPRRWRIGVRAKL